MARHQPRCDVHMPHNEDAPTECVWCGVPVNSSTPPAHDSPSAGAETEGPFSAQLAAVVATARRRAARCGDRDLDTAHLLHSLLESDPAVRAFLGGDGPQAAKLLGYLAQRCIGYGIRWRYTVEDSRVPPAHRGAPETLPGWSPGAAGALRVALERAGARGASHADGVDLLAGLTADESCRAADVLRSSGVDTGALSVMLDVRSKRGDTPVSH